MSNFLTHRLKLLMEANSGMTISELSKAIDVPQPTLHHILAGKTKKPRREILDKIAIYFSVSVNSLLSIQEEELSTTHSKIPVYSLKQLVISNGKIIKEKAITDLIIQPENHGNHLALLIDENAFSPFYPSGSYVILNTSINISDRDTVAFYSNRLNKILIERVIIENGNSFYIEKKASEQNKIILRKISENIDAILGVVVEIRYKPG